jgi:hypothetical protein
MPDSDWSHVSNGDHQQYENAHAAGQPPGPGYSEQEDSTEKTEGTQLTSTTTVTIWEKIEAVPPGEPVSESCSQCPDHVHSVSGDVPEADRDHVPYLRYGDHRGVRYRNSTIRGTEIKREEIVITFKPNPPPAGLGKGLGLQWQPNREHKFVFWKSRTIDRVVNGVIWRSFDTRACTERGEYFVSLDQAADRLVSAIGLSSDSEEPVPTFVGNEFLGLLRSARRLKNPAFTVSRDHGGWLVTLQDAGTPGQAVRRIRMTVEAGRLKYAGDA